MHEYEYEYEYEYEHPRILTKFLEIFSFHWFEEMVDG